MLHPKLWLNILPAVRPSFPSESPVQVSGYTEGVASLKLGERDIEIDDEGQLQF